jgi:hypothetical protein
VIDGVYIVCRPLTRWPSEFRTAGQRRSSPFSAPWSDTQEQLAREARMIGVQQLVIQLAIQEAEIRRDGWPYAAARPEHPGVTVVVTDSDHGRLSWATDRYTSWQANTRAIALSMEALRSADRHGVMQGRQYSGFRELPSVKTTANGDMSAEYAAELLLDAAGRDPASAGIDPARARSQVIEQLATRESVWRDAVKGHHPDRGGDPDIFRQLQTAKAILDGGGS